MEVLILIVVDNGLVLIDIYNADNINISLNPYCSRQWSRTMADVLDNDTNKVS